MVWNGNFVLPYTASNLGSPFIELPAEPCQTERTGAGFNSKCSTSRNTRMRLRHDRTDAVEVASDDVESL